MKNFLLAALAVAATYSISLAQGTGTTQVMLEEFTQASCAPCASQNPAFNALIQSNPGTVNSLKYQTVWPGTDPMNAQNPTEVAARVSYYGTNGVPNAIQGGNYVNGAPGNISQATINNQLGVGAPVEVDVAWDWSNNDLDAIDITVTITNTNSGANFTGADRVHVAIVEEEINFSSPPGSNGERDFYMVMRDMLPNASGNILGTVVPGTPTTLTFTDQALPDYLYDLSEVGVVAFVQKNSTKEIFNSAYQGNLGLPPGVSLVDIELATSTTGPTGYCDYTAIPEILVSNDGATTISSFDVEYSLNGGTAVVESFSGSLGTGQSTTVTFPQATLSGTGQDEISYDITNINGGNTVIASPINSTMDDDIFYTTPQVTTGTDIVEGFSMGLGVVEPDNAYMDNPGDLDVYAVNNFIDAGVVTWNLGAYENSNSCYMWDFYETTGGYAAMVFDKIDLTNSSNTQLSFAYAYARRTFESDRFEVMVSKDCGTTWTTLFDKAGVALTTHPNPVTSERFYPQAADWVTESFDLSAFDGEAEVLVVFKGTSNYGNALYLDDVNLGIGTATKQLQIPDATLEIIPNPVKDIALIQFDVQDNTDLSMTIYNALGQPIKMLTSGSYHGNNTLELNTTDLAAGVYQLTVQTKTGMLTKQFVVQK